MKKAKFLKILFFKLLYKIPTLIGITFIVYIFVSLSEIRDVSSFGYSELMKFISSIFSGYFSWMSKVLTGDLGLAVRDNRPVIDHILERLPATLELNLLTILFSLLVGIPVGIIAAYKNRTFLDKAIEIITFIMFSMPAFWLGLILIILCGITIPELSTKYWGFKIGLPLSQRYSLEIMLEPERYNFFQTLWDHIQHLILPVLTSSIFMFASISRFTRAEIIEILNKDFIVTARAKGISETKLLWKHAFRNALLPIITIIGFMIPALIGSSFIIETVFAWPGIGRFGYQAIFSRDYNAVMALSLFVAVFTLIANSFVDILYYFIDPRISDDNGGKNAFI